MDLASDVVSKVEYAEGDPEGSTKSPAWLEDWNDSLVILLVTLCNIIQFTLSQTAVQYLLRILLCDNKPSLGTSKINLHRHNPVSLVS